MRTTRGFVLGLLVGVAATAAAPSFAATVQRFIAAEAKYPVYVNGSLYADPELPVLNVDGSTYIPLRGVGEALGAEVRWDEASRRVDIGSSEAPQGNNAFRNVTATGSDGSYTIVGEARVFEATMSYAVSDGHRYVLESFHTLDAGAPAWSPFTLRIAIPDADRPSNGTLTLELFEYSAKDGARTNERIVPLETFAPAE